MMTFILGFICGDIAASVVLLFFMGANSRNHPRIVDAAGNEERYRD